MKILYAIQGTGNGHLSRARDIIPILETKGDLDILISGIQADVELPYKIKYRLKGLSFIFGQKGGIDLLATYKKSNLRKFFKEIKSLPVKEYDLIISDFEPVSSWACRLNNKECIGLSHQIAVINKKSPEPKQMDILGKSILHHYAPCNYEYGFHFQPYDKNISTPVIRKEIREAYSENKKHYTVYLPAYSDKRIIKTLQEVKGVEWEVFSKHSKKSYREGKIQITPIHNEKFIKSLITCEGILCGAGFETPAEALFLKKKLMVIPMKGQFEQQCNAAALKKMDIPVLKSLKLKRLNKIQDWVSKPAAKRIINYPDLTEDIIDTIIEKHGIATLRPIALGNKPVTVKRLKMLTFGQILRNII